MSVDRRVLRYTVQVSGELTTVAAGPILHAAPERAIPGAGRLEVWVEASTPDSWPARGAIGTQQLLIVPTGGTAPDGWEHARTVIDSIGMVWHIYRASTKEKP